jgi:hypothetical protein
MKGKEQGTRLAPDTGGATAASGKETPEGKKAELEKSTSGNDRSPEPEFPKLTPEELKRNYDAMAAAAHACQEQAARAAAAGYGGFNGFSAMGGGFGTGGPLTSFSSISNYQNKLYELGVKKGRIESKLNIVQGKYGDDEDVSSLLTDFKELLNEAVALTGAPKAIF